MPVTTAPSRPRAPMLVAALVAAVGLLLAAGCSSSGDDTTSSDSTSATTTTTAGSGTTDTTAGSGTTATTAGPSPSSPSTLPSFDGPCASLAETIGLDQIQPRNASSWVDERQRIVVDAQRESQLLGAARQGAPADVAGQLATMETYASWLATTVQGTSGYSEAVAAVESYPDMVSVSLAIASVQTWQKQNCPD